MNPELRVLNFLRHAARELRKTSDAATARVALTHEERLSRQIERIEAEEAGRAAREQAPEEHAAAA